MHKTPLRRLIHTVFYLGLFNLFAVALLPCSAQETPDAFEEYEIKAVYLFNFASFVAWNTTPSTQAPFSICILGTDPFGKNLDLVLEQEKIAGQSVQIRRMMALDASVSTCQILFISTSLNAQLESILTALKQRPILTVSDLKNFTQRGGMLEFTNENNQVRFNIALETVRAAGLQVSTDLLEIAEIVTPTPTP